MKTIRTFLGLLLLAFLLMFIVMNTGSIRVDLLFLELQAPVSLIVLLASVAGVLLWPLMKPLLPRRKK